VNPSGLAVAAGSLIFKLVVGLLITARRDKSIPATVWPLQPTTQRSGGGARMELAAGTRNGCRQRSSCQGQVT
jgi:hypothetical protein